MAAEKKAPRQGVTVEEINYLVTKLRDLRADLEETVEGIDIKDVIVVDEDVEEG